MAGERGDVQGWEFWAACILGAVLTGLGKGGIPVVGAVTVPMMALAMPAPLAAGLMLPVYIVSDWFGLWAYRKHFDARVLVIGFAGMTIGVVLGYFTFALVPESWINGLIGLVGAVFALNMLVRRNLTPSPRPARVGPGVFWTALAGYTSFISHTGAPPYQVWTLPLGLRKEVYAGTSTIAFAYVNMLKLPFYWHLGQVNPANLTVALVLAPVAVGAVFAGVRLVRILPERLFFQLVTWALLAISLRLIWGALVAA
ncbi:MAG: sulfite exporter TauE/SafE family protein [Paracoccaceae bacterium]